jgi:hypothetical protein
MNRATLLIVAMLLAIPASAQFASECSVVTQGYGDVKAVGVDDLLQMPENYAERPVRTSGIVGIDPQAMGGIRYGLKGHIESGMVLLTPSVEASYNWDKDMLKVGGRELEVTGIVKLIPSEQNQGRGQGVGLLVCSYLLPPDEKAKPLATTTTTLEDLVLKTEQFIGKAVSVEGQFRGANLYGDLPSSTRGARANDFVIKDDVFAVWVTGAKPKGRGWSLDVGMKRDCGKWLSITGRVRWGLGQTVVIEAVRVELVRARTPALLPPPPPPPPKPPAPLAVVFTIPLPNETNVEPTTAIALQFSADLDESTIAGHVLVRLASLRPGDHDFVIRVSYDLGRRTILIDPGEQLPLGRIIEVELLPGIHDIDGREVPPFLLRFKVAFGI